MKDGYIRVASASIDTLIGNVKHNANEIKKVLKETREKKAQVVVFPELVLSGYTLEDLFLQNRLLNECLVQLEEIMHDTKGHQQIVVIGLPFHYQNNLYNVSAVLYDGNILGIVPKYHIPNYNEYYEGRRFTSCFEDNIEIELFGQIVLFGRKVVFACQNLPSFTLGVEICEDLWLPNAPSNELALNGATVICNTSASNELTAKKDYRRNLVSMQSAKLVSGYVYSNAGSGESTTDVVFSGHHLICENGTIINESTGFDAEVIYGDLDVEKLISERRKMTTYQSHHDYDYVYFDMDLIDIETNHYYDPHPFVPSNPALRELRCKEVFEIQTRGLMQRLKATHINKVVIGISGGLDSTLALLVCVMAFEKLGYDVIPNGTEPRYDIIQAVELQTPERVEAFCEGIQAAAPVDSYVRPEPWDMPGYDSPVIMAAGAFVSGSSIELSADAPMRSPYAVYFQGGLTYPHAKYGIIMSLQKMVEKNLIVW